MRYVCTAYKNEERDMEHLVPQDVLMGLASAPPDCSIEDASRIARDLFALHGTPEPKRGERDRNFRIRSDDGRDVLLKISHPTEDPAVVDLQIKAMQHIEAQDPELPIPRVVPTLAGDAVAAAVLSGGREHLVRCMSYLPGATLWECDRTAELLSRVGAVLARTDTALRGFFHPAANQSLAWDLMRVPGLAPFAKLISDGPEREMVSSVLDHFSTVSMPRFRGLRGQIIHNDANLGNVLAIAGSPPTITGLIDFGDAVHGALAAEVAVSGADVVLETEDPMGAACALVAGYHDVLPLEGAELEVLLDGILARLAVTLAIHAWRWDQADGEAPHDIAYEEPCRRALCELTAIDRGDARGHVQAGLRFSTRSPGGGEAGRPQVPGRTPPPCARVRTFPVIWRAASSGPR